MASKAIELFVPAITPFAADLSVDTQRFVARCQVLLEAGAHGLAPFGTTSEANSLTIEERMQALEALIEAGIAPSKLIPGTGCCAIGDSVTLGRHATSLGCKGVLALPPFYYKGVPDEGVFDAFSRMIDGIADDALRVYLYHIPQMSGVPITLGLIEKLLKAYPKTIAGLKDSSGSWENTEAVMRNFPGIDSYSASEAMIPRNAATGGAGCISASANVNPAGIRRLIDALGTDAEAGCHEQVSAVRKIFEGLPLIPAIKAAVATQMGDAGYGIVRPPFVAAGAEHDAQIADAVAIAGPQKRAGQ